MEVTFRVNPVVLAAEIAKHYFPKLVELHNYSTAHSVTQKKYNWVTLNSAITRDNECFR